MVGKLRREKKKQKMEGLGMETEKKKTEMEMDNAGTKNSKGLIIRGEGVKGERRYDFV